MIASDVATLLERIATKVEALPGVSRTNPHAFAEAKSELKGEILGIVKRLRAAHPLGGPRRGAPGPIEPGTRRIGGRLVAVERRRRA